MAAELKCMRCGSAKVASAVELRLSLGSSNVDVSKVNKVLLAVDLDPGTSKFLALRKDYESCRVTARVCGECGFVELVAEDPLRIYTAASAMTVPMR